MCGEYHTPITIKEIRISSNCRFFCFLTRFIITVSIAKVLVVNRKGQSEAMTIITNQQKWLWSEHYVTGHHSANIRHIVKIECEVFEETIWLLLRAFTADVTHGFSVVRVARSLVLCVLLFFYMYILITVVIMSFATEVSDKYEGLSIDCWNTVVCQSTFYFPLGTSDNLIWTIPIFQHSESKWSLTYIQ
jgi:hypothetical protein